MQFMSETVNTRFTTRDDHMPYHLHAVGAERTTPHCGCAMRSTVRNDLHTSRHLQGGAAQDDASAARQQANGPRSMVGASHAVDRHTEVWVTAALEAITYAVAARDWEYAEALIDQIKSAWGATGRTRAVGISDPARQPDSDDTSEPLLEPLRARELEVLTLVAAGYSNQDIAEQLIVSVGTVRWHLKNIYSKLDVHSRTQAIARVRTTGLLN